MTTRILRNIGTLVLILNCLSYTNVLASPNSKYIAKYKPIAISLSSKYNIPPEVILAIAIFESDSGRSRIAMEFKNHFGIVGKNYSKRKSNFKQYTSVKESYRDFCRKISNLKRCRNLNPKTEVSIWVDQISKSGYSSQPTKWKRKIMRTISTNNLSAK